MLVTFSCEGHHDVVYLGHVAQQLIHLMGRSDTIPSAMTAEEVGDALERLQKALNIANRVSITHEDGEADFQVSLAHRAIPLIELLKHAEKNERSVMWS